jgi:nucleotide-binding universal stress UspA family protein
MRFAQILCPIDFSETSAHAVDQAIVLAAGYRARITALHVHQRESPLPAWDGVDLVAGEPTESSLREKVVHAFAAARAKGLDVEVAVHAGSPVTTILEHATVLPADLIVMGTHGTSGFQHLVLGSVTEKVLRKAVCPVLTVPPRTESTSELPFRRLLCAVDFSDASLEAVRVALSLAQDSRARLTLMHVLEWPWEEPPAPTLEGLPPEQGMALEEFRRYTEKSAKQRLLSLIPDSTFSAQVSTRLRNGKPYVQVLSVAQEERADLIVLGVRGRNPLDQMIFGSTANQLVRRATCPVLTVR